MTDQPDTTPPDGFETLGLAAPVLAAVRDVGYESPSPIQRAAIPPLLEGKDLLGQAQTGTGKTAAFALPLLSRLDLKLAQPQVVVLTPTRELAIQVAEAMQTYARHLKGFHVLPVYGGQGMAFQLKQLKRGVHAVVGTPGRIQDHLRRGTLKLDRLRAVVIDEADEMLRMGFIDDVEDILQQMPEEKQVALFSATLPDRIRRVVQHHLHEPVEIKIRNKTATVAAIDQRFVEIRGFDKLEALTRILEAEDFDAMLVFVRTRQATAELTEKLEARGFAAAALSGEMTQVARERTVERLKNGKLDIVVATDVAARGLDVERVTHVINYDVPYDAEAYIHRIGRTGRAGREGHAILFVMPRERRLLAAIERATRQKVTPMPLPTRADVADRRAGQFKARITEVLDKQDLEFFERLVGSYAAEHGKEPLAIAAALAFLAQQDRPLTPPEEPRRPERADRSDHREDRGDDGRDRAHERPARREAARERPRRSGIGAGVPEGFVRYRIEVGHAHGVQPGNIVGAIANEAGIDSAHIGLIKILDEHSTVDLPEGMPNDIFHRLRKAWVCGQKLAISVDSPDGAPSRPPPARRPDRPHKRKKQK
ncbi:MAG TPA: DEAD/DEAH box helicase [Gammaproteobacteria bacterium]|nr:DEAD/DEAH box helicase [Gammaproteobacteria bacterium]